MTEEEERESNDNEEREYADDFIDMISQLKEEKAIGILNDLINAKENLDMKTEINNPLSLSALKTLSHYIKKRNLNITSYYINYFIKVYLRYMVSNKRRSRKEIVNALINLKEDEEKESKIKAELEK